MKQLTKKIKINTTIELLTGLHIGGNKDNVEIGGIDNPVIKIATRKDQPYIPGSSIKGKMRCLLEQVRGAVEVCANTEVNKLFGSTEQKKLHSENQPSKIIVRDAYLTEESVRMLMDCTNLDMPYTENKFENTINRVEGVAKNPRQTERVPAGALFDAEFIINVWDSDGDGQMLLELFKEGLSLIENDYIGGSGSRGYGQIKFGELCITELTADNGWK